MPRAHKPRSYIAVEVYTPAGKPISDIKLELTAPDGSVTSCSSDENGEAALRDIEPGSYRIALPARDMDSWKASGGASALLREEPGPIHVVRQGECLLRIAHAHGQPDWQKIWDAPQNAGLKAKRKNPNILLPGDRIVMPAVRIGQARYRREPSHRRRCLRHPGHGAAAATSALQEDARWTHLRDQLRTPGRTGDASGCGAKQRGQELGAKAPAALALACGSLNTFFGTIGALEQLKQGVKLERKNIEAWYELGKNTLGLVDSLAALQDAMAPKIEGYSPWLKKLSPAITKATRTVSVLDAGYNLATGLELLFSDDGALAYELRQGRTVRGLALRAKGVLQLASAAGSGAMSAGLLTLFGGASATGFLAAAAGPVGLSIAVGGVLIACIDSALDLTSEFGAQVSALEEALDGAERKELPRSEKSLLATRRVQRVQELTQNARWS